MATVTTPWGKATSLETVSVRQRSGERRFTTRVELLAGDDGERLVRFSYATDGTARRGPVTLRERDLANLRVALERTSELSHMLGDGGITGTKP